MTSCKVDNDDDDEDPQPLAQVLVESQSWESLESVFRERSGVW